MEETDKIVTTQKSYQNPNKTYNIELKDQQLMLEMNLLSNSIKINIIEINEVMADIYEYELTFNFIKEKDSNLAGLGNISKTFDYFKSLFEKNEYTINKKTEEIYLISLKYTLFIEEKKFEIEIPKQKLDEQEQNQKVSLAIKKLQENNVELEEKLKNLEASYQNALLTQNEKLGLDNIINDKVSFTMKNEENNLEIELRFSSEQIEIRFIENKNIIEEKYSIKLNLEDFCSKDDYFSIMKNIEQLHDFIKLIFENNKYKIKKNEKDDYYILTINFISGIQEKTIDFKIVKSPFCVVDSIKQYTHSINYMSKKLKEFEDYKPKNEKTVENITNDIVNFKKEIEEKFNEMKNSIKKEILELSHPIGSYYWSQKDIDPSTIFGGKWEPIKGRFIFAVDDNHAVNTTGGEELHTLTVEEIPAHNHGFPKPVCAYKNVPSIQSQGGGENKSVYENDGNVDNTNNAGSGKPYNNMPPYICAFCWRRIEDEKETKK